MLSFAPTSTPEIFASVPPSGAGSTGEGARFAGLRSALAAFEGNPDRAELRTDLRTALRRASDEISRLPRNQAQDPVVAEVGTLIAAVRAAGTCDDPLDATDLSLVRDYAKRGWQGTLATMLLSAAWRLPDASLLQTVPAWLQPEFVAWLFAAPQSFSGCGDAEAYAAHTLRKLEELTRWLNRSPGASAMATVLGAYAAHASVIPLYFSQGDLRRHAELRATLLQRAHGMPGDRFSTQITSRANRRLRVGIVNRHFGPQTETYTTLPTFEQLDPERFEVLLFSHHSGDSALEAHCRRSAAELAVLPEDLSEQLALLRAASLDVVVFGTNVTAVCNEVTRLALHRVAPLQVVNNSSCITSGLPEVDLYVSGSLTESNNASAHFSERLGLLPGPAHAFNYQADYQEAKVSPTRAELGLPKDAIVYVSAANYFKIIPEMQHAWARLLAAVPGSHLLVHPFNPNWSSSYPIVRFRTEFTKVLAEYGVAASRLVVSTARFPSRTDVKALLSLGDVYLDTFPFGGVNSLVDPLELGLPVVVWEGEPFRSRMGAALLRTLGLTELVATNADDYQVLATQLGKEIEKRTVWGNRIRTAMECTPVFLDSLAASEAFGDLIEAAYDELATVGRAAFRKNPQPLRAALASTAALESHAPPQSVAQAREILRASPANAAARHVIGRGLLDRGRSNRAVTYLLAALQGRESDASLWLDLATALRADGQVSQAIEALEAGLRIDDSRVEGWVMLAELAHAVGGVELAREAAGIVRKLAPADSRVQAYL